MARGRCGRGGPIASLCELRGTAPDERSHRTKRGHIEAIVGSAARSGDSG
jgi:hypothetical protein